MTTKTYTALRNVPQAITDRRDFEGSSIRGRSFQYGCGYIHPGKGSTNVPEDSVYVVWSYATPIAWITPAGDLVRVTERFSVTTSKHLGKCYLTTPARSAALDAASQD